MLRQRRSKPGKIFRLRTIAQQLDTALVISVSVRVPTPRRKFDDLPLSAIAKEPSGDLEAVSQESLRKIWSKPQLPQLLHQLSFFFEKPWCAQGSTPSGLKRRKSEPQPHCTTNQKCSLKENLRHNLSGSTKCFFCFSRTAKPVSRAKQVVQELNWPKKGAPLCWFIVSQRIRYARTC